MDACFNAITCCQSGSVKQTTHQQSAKMNITTIGIDLAKSVLSGAGNGMSAARR